MLGQRIAQEIPQRAIVLSCRLFRCDDVKRCPAVSIITTVYDRVERLKECRETVCALQFTDFEHVIVADAPPRGILVDIERTLDKFSESNSVILASLERRRNDWGISPAAMGLAMARGKYVCFLSDDNGYTPNHLDELVHVLEDDPEIGFVYSSCCYGGRWILNDAPPQWGKIDLGQPLFRRVLFDKYLGGTLPFYEYAWDWRMIDTFMRNRVKWKHIDQQTFIFRLANYLEYCRDRNNLQAAWQ